MHDLKVVNPRVGGAAEPAETSLGPLGRHSNTNHSTRLCARRGGERGGKNVVSHGSCQWQRSYQRQQLLVGNGLMRALGFCRCRTVPIWHVAHRPCCMVSCHAGCRSSICQGSCRCSCSWTVVPCVTRLVHVVTLTGCQVQHWPAVLLRWRRWAWQK